MVRDQPNASSMGVRNRLNAFMLMDVITTTAADMMTMAIRGSRISVSGWGEEVSRCVDAVCAGGAGPGAGAVEFRPDRTGPGGFVFHSYRP